MLLALAASLWLASQEPRPLPAQAVQIPIEKIANPLATDLVLNGLGMGADLITTDYALNHGCYEANPLAPRVEGRVALKMGVGAIRGAVAYWLRRSGHKRGADVFRWVGLAVDMGISVNNVACASR